MSTNVKALKADELRYTCNSSDFKFKSTAEIDSNRKVIAQDRAVDALEFGLGMDSNGYNIYVAGISGTGRTTIVNALVEKIAKTKPVPPDWCFLHNFRHPDRPIAVQLPSGKGCEFKRDMRELVEKIMEEMPKIFEGKEYENQKNTLVNKYQNKKQKLFADMDKEAAKAGFELQNTQSGLMTIPLLDGNPIKAEDYKKLPAKVRKEIEKKQLEINNKVRSVFKLVRILDKEARESVDKLNRKTALWAVGHMMDDLENNYGKIDKLSNYLNDVKEDIIANLKNFIGLPAKEQNPLAEMMQQPQEDIYKRYEVNVVVENCQQKGAPVIEENHPTYYNMIGSIERESRMGTVQTNFTKIKAGSIIRANGGYLIVRAEDVLSYPAVWDALKKAILKKKVYIEDMGEQFGHILPVGLKPDPIPVRCKVIMVGNPYYYHMLHSHDDDFRKIFKVKADFDSTVPNNKKLHKAYSIFISGICKEEGLKHFSPEGVATIVEYGVRMVSDQKKLSIRFGDIADIVREASYWAGKDKKRLVGREHVCKAVKEKKRRSSLTAEKMQDMIIEGTVMIDTKGSTVGQINGLAVFSLGDYSFGKPSRITVNTFMGEEGLINIERKVKLSGATYDKGILILAGYLGGKFAKDRPLSLSASICFEQSYNEIDGDSASSTELYAILSALSGIPIKQGLAVTGSVNQRGEIQPIGGVNQKIEGFFEVCRDQGLTGEQGVLIPHQNVRNLMLNDEVVQAVRDGKFNIYPVKTVEQGIEILTGVKAGKINKKGTYSKDSVFAKVDARLDEIHEYLKGVGNTEDGDD